MKNEAMNETIKEQRQNEGMNKQSSKAMTQNILLAFLTYMCLGSLGASVGVGFSIKGGLLLAFLTYMGLSGLALVLALEEVLVLA